MIIGLIVLVIAVVIIFWFIGVYNNLVASKKRVENAWAQIDVQLKRRHDLIPNLVNAVKGYMKFERETLEKVIQARTKAVSAKNIDEKIQAEGVLGGALGRLLAIVENYPELKANENVKQLMEELTTTENRITYARQFYNDTVTKFNTKIEIFPNNIVAGMYSSKFKPFPLFEITDESEREVPKVDLG
ncbi:LemA family protein [Kosmotoga olearia]|uniref:LemA family protein n=1 Tax=Kosmotoga olearia (strain ATCC BAA-1733 / DSM 21960 / TBF 19.5.1) TaxID=521045 RepID=C5CII2_KOSOT|nr:LemA family protein [Kosmotoga olearia]ACR79845.1 LemA family protein [Kosmotoga olearia TBF 19.5.1]